MGVCVWSIILYLFNYAWYIHQFYLSGGTALAEFYLKHRYSDDLDFFTDTKDFPQFEVEQFVQNIKTALGAASLEYRPVTMGSEFAKVRSVTRLPRMIQPLAIEELKAFFSDRARELKNIILDQ